MHELRNRTLARFLAEPGRFAVCGTGATGESVLDALADRGLKPLCFLDADRIGMLRGLEIVPPEEALDLDTVVIAGRHAREMTVGLRADGFEGRVIDGTGLHRAASRAFHDEALLDAAGDAVDFARSLLKDDGSREVFDAVVAYRRQLDPGLLPPALPAATHPALPVVDGAWVVHVGDAPDAVLELAHAVGPLGRVHALASDPGRARALDDALAGDAACGRVLVHAAEDASTRSVDELVWEETPGRIDRLEVALPGALGILDGAAATLRERRPRLTVDLGHAPADLWEVPVRVKERSPGYRLRLGQHGPDLAGTRLHGDAPGD